MIQKTLLIVILLSFPLLNQCIAEVKIKPMDIINKAPRCYVLSEFLTLYVQDNSKILENYYINYYNASVATLGDNFNANTVPLFFNEQAVNRRKILIKSLIKNGYKPEYYEDLYKKLSCEECSKMINIESYLID